MLIFFNLSFFRFFSSLASPHAGWAFTFCIAKKVNKNARKSKLPPVKQQDFRAAATKYNVYFLSLNRFIICSLNFIKKSNLIAMT